MAPPALAPSSAQGMSFLGIISNPLFFEEIGLTI
jgi:hypothetical protein